MHFSALLNTISPSIRVNTVKWARSLIQPIAVLCCLFPINHRLSTTHEAVLWKTNLLHYPPDIRDLLTKKTFSRRLISLNEVPGDGTHRHTGSPLLFRREHAKRSVQVGIYSRVVECRAVSSGKYLLSSRRMQGGQFR